VASICYKSHECSPLSFMASNSEPKQFFRFTYARWGVLEHFELENQHLAADGFQPAIFAFQVRLQKSEMHMLSVCCFIIATSPTLSILPKFSIGLRG
jgi:hypothetical protein